MFEANERPYYIQDPIRFWIKHIDGKDTNLEFRENKWVFVNVFNNFFGGAHFFAKGGGGAIRCEGNI